MSPAGRHRRICGMLRWLAVLGLVPALGLAQGLACHDLQALTPIALDYLAT